MKRWTVFSLTLLTGSVGFTSYFSAWGGGCSSQACLELKAVTSFSLSPNQTREPALRSDVTE